MKAEDIKKVQAFCDQKNQRVLLVRRSGRVVEPLIAGGIVYGYLERARK